MDLSKLSKQEIVIVGCGKMGSALLKGWLAEGLDPNEITVIDPNPSDWLIKQTVRLNKTLPINPSIVLIAVKPQMMPDVVPKLNKLGNSKTLFISIAAGTSISYFQRILGNQTPIVRAMPNTPASIGKGITAIIANAYVSDIELKATEKLLSSVGEIVSLDSEEQMDAVTAVSGSGPAYVFHLIEALADAGQANGLNAELSMTLAKATVAGAGLLAEKSNEDPTNLRINVTSPGGTTAAALKILMDQDTGFNSLLLKAVEAASNRSKELRGSEDG
ncbi:MAG: pyrroline-5-carboxylate reductase [Rhodobacterales bacterium]|mgnify:FL=1